MWLFTVTASIFLNLIYSYFFFNNFSDGKKTDKSFRVGINKNLEVTRKSTTESNFVSKHDLNLILYSWLTNSKSLKHSKVVDKLFEKNINDKNWLKTDVVFNNLYKTSFFLNLSKFKSNNDRLDSAIGQAANRNKQFGTASNDLFLNNLNFSENILQIFLNNYTIDEKSRLNLFYKNNLILTTKSRFEWNLYNFNTELTQYPFITKSKPGLFFLNDFNYNKMSFMLNNFSELWSLNHYTKNQLSTAKWNRWLYRYSILHRKILKNSHKITLSKRLLNSGIFDSKIFDKNIWNNQYLSKYSNFSQSAAIFDLFYSNSFPNKTQNYNSNNQHLSNNLITSDNLNVFKDYENSYFWFLKRFYTFNTLPTNRILSKNQIKIKDQTLALSDFKNTQNNQFTTLYAYLLKSNYLTHGDLNNFCDLQVTNPVINGLGVNMNSSNFKDVFVLTGDNDLFSKDNLNILYWISASSTHLNHLTYFNYINCKTQLVKDVPLKFHLNKNLTNHLNFNFYLLIAALESDHVYLNDMVYLSLFY